jgi:hypothetical protein
MAVLLGSVKTYDNLDSFQKGILKELKKEVQNKSTEFLKKALKDLIAVRLKYGNKGKKTLSSDLYNDFQQEIILSEINSRK